MYELWIEKRRKMLFFDGFYERYISFENWSQQKFQLRRLPKVSFYSLDKLR